MTKLDTTVQQAGMSEDILLMSCTGLAIQHCGTIGGSIRVDTVLPKCMEQLCTDCCGCEEGSTCNDAVDTGRNH